MPLWLISALGWLRRAAGAVLKAVATYPWQAACVGLLAASAWLWHGWDGADAKLKSCEAARVADHAAYIAAQKAALEKAQAAKAKAEQDYRTLAETTDANEQKARRDAMADAEHYIATHRVRSQAVNRTTGPASSAAEYNGTAGGNSAGSAPVLDEVTVSADDIRICTTNTSRLEAVHNWALQLTAH